MTTFTRRSLLAGSMALGATGLLSACSGGSSSPEAAPSQSSGPAKLRVWFMDGSVTEEGRALLKSQFEKQNPGSTLTVEVQPWDGVLSKLQTALASPDQTPDIVELGNTQTSTFSTVGALADVTDMKAELGGDDLIKSFVEAATLDGKVFAYPFYAAARGVYYRKDLYQAAGIAVPKTMDEFIQGLVKLQAANPEKKAGFSSIYCAAGEVHVAESLFFSMGGDYATFVDGKWTGAMSSEKSQAALKKMQTIYKDATTFALDSVDGIVNSWQQFNNGKAASLVATGFVEGKLAPMSSKLGVFVLPSNEAGVAGSSFAGGSNIAIAAKSKQQQAAKAALKIIFGDEFQKAFVAEGVVPGRLSQANGLPGQFGKIARQTVESSKLTPNTPQWGVFDGDNTLKDFWTQLAKGGDASALAKTLDEKFASTLNQK